MRELNTMETNAVSGAGLFADAAAALGLGIGAIVDAKKGDGSTDGAAAGQSMGAGIGAIVDAGLGTILGLLNSLFGNKVSA